MKHIVLSTAIILIFICCKDDSPKKREVNMYDRVYSELVFCAFICTENGFPANKENNDTTDFDEYIKKINQDFLNEVRRVADDLDQEKLEKTAKENEYIDPEVQFCNQCKELFQKFPGETQRLMRMKSGSSQVKNVRNAATSSWESAANKAKRAWRELFK